MIVYFSRFLGYFFFPLFLTAWQFFFYPFLPSWLSVSLDAVFCVSVVFLLPFQRGFFLMVWFGILLDAIRFPMVSLSFFRYPFLFFFLTWLFERFFTNRSHISFIALTVACRCLLTLSFYLVRLFLQGDAALFFPSGIFVFLDTLCFDIVMAWIFSHLHQRLLPNYV